jgi:hypothetical protein
VRIAVEGFPDLGTHVADGRLRIPLGTAMPGPTPLACTCMAESAGGVGRGYDGFLTFIGVPRFTGDWSVIPRVGVDEARFVPQSAYGHKRPWPGPEVISAGLHFAWTDSEFLFRAEVRDAVHFQPFEGHYVYNADCLQLAIDPMLRRSDLLGNVYAFNLALTPRGPELYRWLAPQEEATSAFRPPANDVSLGGRYLSIEPVKGGLVYTLRLPWGELAPCRPEPGARLGSYLILMNNDGGGLIDTLHWPVPIHGMWTVPRRWGVLTLLG